LAARSGPNLLALRKLWHGPFHQEQAVDISYIGSSGAALEIWTYCSMKGDEEQLLVQLSAVSRFQACHPRLSGLSVHLQ
jgi:hypothetical protein